ncbi:hypothetical protein [Streptomyces sp. NPDC055055]
MNHSVPTNSPAGQTISEVDQLRAQVAELEALRETTNRILAHASEQLGLCCERITELEAERHSTNEALSDAAVALREMRDRIAALSGPHHRATDGELADQLHLVDPLDHTFETLAPRSEVV